MNKFRLSSCILFILFLFPLQGRGITHFMPSDGLPGIDVTAICEDENYIWIATNDGLARYDGSTFKSYRSSLDKNSLSSNNIETIYSDSSGRLWIGFKAGGVDIYDPRSDHFISLSSLFTGFPQRVVSLYEDSRNTMWVGTWEEGLLHLIPDDRETSGFRMERHYPGNIVTGLVEKPEGKLWIGTYNGLFLYDLDHNRGVDIGLNEFAITQLEDYGDKDELWFSTWGDGLCLATWDSSYHPTFNTMVNGSTTNIYCFSRLNKASFYTGTWGDGIKQTDIRGREEKDFPFPINASVALCFFRDRYNRLWTGTYGLGLYCIEDYPQGIEETDLSDFTAGAAYTLSCLDGKELLIGTQGDGLFIHDLDNGMTRHISISGRDDFFNRYILSIYEDEELTVVGNDSNGFNYIRSDSLPDGRWLTCTDDNSFGKITVIHRQGNLFCMGTKQSGIYTIEYDPVRNVFHTPRHFLELGINEITGIEDADEGYLWVSTHKGLFLFSPRDGEVSSIPGSEMIYAMSKSRSGDRLWLGTSNGLKLFSGSLDDSITTPSFAQSLPIGTIRALAVDESDNLWFSVSNHIFCHTAQDTDNLRQIDPGARGSEYYYSSISVPSGEDEFLFFGGTGGLITINASQILHQEERPKILLTDIQLDYQQVGVGDKVHGKIILHEAPEYIRELTIPRECRWIRFSFSDQSDGVFHNTYEYRIEGLSDRWHHLDTGKPLSFSMLPPGDYSFNIRNSGGQAPSEDPLWSLKLSVPKPWWNTTPFYLLLTAAIAMLVISAILILRRHYARKSQRYQEEIKRQEEEELLREKEGFFTQLSHDIMTPLSLVLAPVNDLRRDPSISEDQKEKLDIVGSNAEYLSNLFSTILNFKRAEINGHANVERPIELNDFIRMTLSSFEYLSKTKGIRMDYDTTVSPIHIKVDTFKLERVLYNILDNSLKYSDEGSSVRVSLSCPELSRTMARISVSDSGSGIAPENLKHIFDKFFRGNSSQKDGLGLGLYTARRFMEDLGGTLSARSAPGEGTCMMIDLPIQEIPGDESRQDSAVADFTILIVEDNSQLREYLRQKLSASFEVAVASDGEEGLKYVKKNLPEIVISDVMMPRMDGLSFCHAIKSELKLGDIFVILLSAKGSTEDEAEGYRAGADFYMKKPFDPDVLLSQITNVYNTFKRVRQSGEDRPSGYVYDMKHEFVAKATKVAQDNLSDDQFNLDAFAAEMGMSKPVLHRKFNLYIGDSPNNFIKQMRLQKAARLLISSDMTVSEIAYTSGFSQSHYFIKCFKDTYGTTPLKFREANKQQS